MASTPHPARRPGPTSTPLSDALPERTGPTSQFRTSVLRLNRTGSPTCSCPQSSTYSRSDLTTGAPPRGAPLRADSGVFCCATHNVPPGRAAMVNTTVTITARHCKLRIRGSICEPTSPVWNVRLSLQNLKVFKDQPDEVPDSRPLRCIHPDLSLANLQQSRSFRLPCRTRSARLLDPL